MISWVSCAIRKHVVFLSLINLFLANLKSVFYIFVLACCFNIILATSLAAEATKAIPPTTPTKDTCLSVG